MHPTANICGDQQVIRRVTISSNSRTGKECGGGVQKFRAPKAVAAAKSSAQPQASTSSKAKQSGRQAHPKLLPHSRSSGLRCLRRFEFDVRTSIDDIDQRPPPRCPRKSSRSPALPSALTRATYVHPEIHHRMRSEKDEGGNIMRERDTDQRIGRKEHRLTRLACIQKVTPRQVKPRVSRTKGHLSKRTAFVRDVVKEVSGYAFSPLPSPGLEPTGPDHTTRTCTNPPCTASPPTSVALSNSSATPRTSARASSRRRGSVPSAVARERLTR